ncbi:MAG: T9SS type A sorting domain-containing protein [Cyclobacteriaceae bacterium]|nr:T9SS type A sorting domain-containing protein [Cyclobacteriaceae bacterium]
MSRISLTLFFVLTLVCVHGQIFPVDTLLKTGDIRRRINLVFLSDGYQAHEMNTYITDVNRLLTDMFSQVPFKHYRNYFNAFAIKVPSNQSGAKHPRTSSDSDCAPVPQQDVDNYFGSTFDYGNIHRLLVPTKAGTIAVTLANNFPLFDQAFVLVNSPFYGGSGGSVAASSTHSNANEVSIHEIGHSFAGLADEYWAGSAYAFERPNLTQQNNPSLVKWASWVGHAGVGVYPHAEASNWFRPHQNCKMRYLNVPFCDVCNETFVERIHTLVNPIDEYSPRLPVVALANEPLQFSVNYVKPEPNTMSVIWKKDGAVLATNQDAVTVPVASFTTAQTIITATLTDNTALSRSAAHTTSHAYVIEWTVTAEAPVTGVKVQTELLKYEVSVFPNPVVKDLQLSYVLPRDARVKVVLEDLSGRRLTSLLDEQQGPGSHSLSVDVSDILKSSGVYVVAFQFDELITFKRIIKPD